METSRNMHDYNFYSTCYPMLIIVKLIRIREKSIETQMLFIDSLKSLELIERLTQANQLKFHCNNCNPDYS